jgi:hypothetical protein
MTQRRWPWPPWFWSASDLSEQTAGPLAPGSFGVHAFSVQSEVDGVEGLTLYVTYIVLGVLGPNPNENPPEVHQLVYQGAFRAWQDSNLSAQVDPPVLIPDQKPVAYIFRTRGHVIYLGIASQNSEDHEIQEFFADQSGWHGNNLSRTTGAPSPSRASPIAYVAEFEQTQHVHYIGRDGHLHELWNSGGWHWHDLTVASGAPLALSGTSPAGFVSEVARTQHVYFVGQDGQVHGIRWKAGNWSPHDPDLVGGTPGSASVSPVGYSLDGVERVAYVGLNGQVHELSFDGNAWDHQNPSEETNTSVQGNGALAAYPGLIPGTRRIIVIPEGGSIQQLSNDGGGWEFTVLLDSNGPNQAKGADAGARPGAFSAPAALQEYVYYPSINFRVVELAGRPSLRGPLPPSILSLLHP